MEYKENSKCRTCLIECNNLMLLASDYLDCNELMSFADIITACTSVEMTIDDKMPQYICETCASKARNAYAFKKQCENSDAILKSQLPLIKHDDNKVVFYTCQTCSRSFNSAEDLTLHLREHEDRESLYQCLKCPVKFTTQQNLDKHIAREHDTKKSKLKFTCSFCSETFNSEYLLNEHSCMQTTNTLRTLRRSRREAVKKIEENRDTSSEYSDDNCDSDFNTSELEDCSVLIKPEFKPITTNEVENNSKDVKQEKLDDNITWQKILKYSTQKNEDGLYECICCIEKFEKLSDLREHTRSHKIFNCKLCKKRFTIVSNLRRHLRSHTDDPNVKQEDEDSSMKENVSMSNEFRCVACTKTFARRKMLSEHLKTHSVFACVLCDVKFTFATNLRKHLRWHKRPKEEEAARVCNQPPAEKRTCDICFKVFKYRPSMLKHRRKHDNLGKPCPYCDQVFSNSIKLYKHMDENHEHEKNVVCQECGKKFFKEWNLKMHMNVHTGVRPYMCEICGASFALSGNLNAHKRLHTGHKPYKCDTCGRGFTQQAALRSHEAGHSNRRDHVCPECGAAFTRAGAMRNHRKRHATREFPCNMCGKRFTFSSERKRHMLIHTGEKNYVCDFCGKAFNRPTNLRVHRRIHTGEHPHKCNICGKGFIQAHCIKKHMNSHRTEEQVVESRPSQPPEVQQNDITSQIVIVQPFL